MAILQLILTSIFRSLGKILNTAFGWATSLLFGKVPEKRQLYLSGIAFASILWLVVLLGIFLPRFAAFLLALVPLESIRHAGWVRLVMLAVAALLPAGVGFLALFLVHPHQRPKGADRVKAIPKGYPFTICLAPTLVLKRKDLEVLLDPSDLVVRGTEQAVTRAHALLPELLTFTRAYQTWTKEANQVEDRLAALWHEFQQTGGHTEVRDALDKLRAVD